MGTERRGLATLVKTDPEKARSIARMGGLAGHNPAPGKRRAHEWTSAEARAAGRKGGTASALARRKREES